MSSDPVASAPSTSSCSAAQQEKRSRCEESLDGVPPAKLQSPAPSGGDPEISQASAPAPATAIAASVVPAAGAQAHGAVLPAPVASTSGVSAPEVPSPSTSSPPAAEWVVVAGKRRSKPLAVEVGRKASPLPRSKIMPPTLSPARGQTKKTVAHTFDDRYKGAAGTGKPLPGGVRKQVK